MYAQTFRQVYCIHSSEATVHIIYVNKIITLLNTTYELYNNEALMESYAFIITFVLVPYIVNGATTEIIQEIVYGIVHMVKRQNA